VRLIGWCNVSCRLPFIPVGRSDRESQTMVRTAPDTAARFIPPRVGLPGLRKAASGCTACPLYKTGTQTVFGEGPQTARVMLVGEQPGDVEDRTGRPFVGPAGKLLDRALADAGLDRSRVYVTNVVKHFKWVQRGKRRLHKRPGSLEIVACKPWLEAEIAVTQPLVILCLGATAAQAILGRGFRLTHERGRFVPSPLARFVMATVHPSALLRLPDAESRHREYGLFVSDLRAAAKKVGGGRGADRPAARVRTPPRSAGAGAAS
jgi:uracil-DNA glycosylase